MIARLSTGSGIALALVAAQPALAQSATLEPDAADRPEAENDAEIQRLRDELAQLRAKLDALQARLDATEAAPELAAASAPAETLAPDEQPEHLASIAETNWTGAPTFRADNGWSFKPRGRLHLDFGNVDAPDAINDDGLGFSSELRRMRLGAEGEIPGGFGYRVELEFADGDPVLSDGYITYKTGGLTLTAGQHNNFQSLAEVTSSNDTALIERAAFTDAFNFERRLGLSAQYSTGPWLVQGGIFTDNTADLGDDGNNSMSLDGRLVFAPKIGAAQIHLGGSAHWRDLGDRIVSTRYRQRPAVHSSDVRFVDTDSLEGASSETNYGLEALIIAGRFHAAGEAHWLDLDRIGATDPGFFGAYAEVGYFLAGDGYGYRNGVLRAPAIDDAVGEGGIGALALTLRYDLLDLNDASAGVTGGKQSGYLAGISWWPVDNLRFLLNYARLRFDDAAIPAANDRDYAVDVVSGRAQISF